MIVIKGCLIEFLYFCVVRNLWEISTKFSFNHQSLIAKADKYNSRNNYVEHFYRCTYCIQCPLSSLMNLNIINIEQIS